ncbi:MAG: glycoside hydrolase family 127 protein [Candidatus Hydrogenedentes bacterium]|nr:glycoside hydrolase family 127 protein [Candidatus Hydrogenedentota bacterium]
MKLLLMSLAPFYVLDAVHTFPPIYPITPVPFTEVQLNDGFWKNWVTLVGSKFLPHNLKYCESEGKIDNFRVVCGKKEGKHVGFCFEDSDVYKVIEGAGYWLALTRDPALENQIDEIINLIECAQQPDGYLNTFFTLVKPDKRWTNDEEHETYCAGHLFEAAVSYYQATGKRKLLDIAIRFADHICETFGTGKVEEVPQHEEIELALIKLSWITGTKKYSEMAKWFIEQRGKPYKDKPHGRWGSVCQDHKPIIEQDEIFGHAVRAMYLYSAVTDYVSITGDERYLSALNKLWYDLTERKMYITAGIGDSLLRIEGFSNPYYLPNDTAYCETCASIGLVLWAHRMFMLQKDGKFIDVIERALYNTPLSGLALSGDAIFYCNKLEGIDRRPPWQECACCPTNVVRFIPTIAGYQYALEKDVLYVLHYISSLFSFGITPDNKLCLKSKDSNPSTPSAMVSIQQSTNYPWEGKVELTLEMQKPQRFTIALRIPDWVYRGSGSTERLYHYPDSPGLEKVILSINGEQMALSQIQKGFAHITREWKNQDKIEIEFPMAIQRVYANEKVEANRGKVAIQRGPIVFCAEDVDNKGLVRFVYLPKDAKFSDKFESDLLGGVVSIETMTKVKSSGVSEEISHRLKMIPYYAWANREKGYMKVWLPETPDLVPILSLEARAIVDASYKCPTDSYEALNDSVEPKSSSDTSVPRFTWWDHKGTSEWVQYKFDKKYKVKGVKVYWFDDTGFGQCRVPKSWEIMYLKDGKWVPVPKPSPRTTNKDKYNEVVFKPVETNAIRLVVNLQPDFSGGILEWKVIVEEQ